MNREAWIQYKRERNAKKKNPMAGCIGQRYGKKCVAKVLLRFGVVTDESLRQAVLHELGESREFNQYLLAIKKVRSLSQMELKEAKDFVDAIRDEIDWRRAM